MFRSLYTLNMENSCPNTPTFNIGLFEDIIPSIPDFSPSGDEELTRIDEELTRIDEDEACISVDEQTQNLPPPVETICPNNGHRERFYTKQ